MTKLAYFSLNTFIKSKIQDLTICKKATSIALGVAIARIIPLPSSEVESAEAHFNSAVRAAANEQITCFNEEIVVDIDLVLETVRSYWLTRYFSAHPNMESGLVSIGDYGFLTKLSGAARYLNLDTQAFCDKHSELMIVLVNQITRVLCAKEA